MGSEVQRRLRLTLDVGADDLRSLGDELRQIANDLEIDGREVRTVTSGGWSSGYHLKLVLTDPEMTGDRYREHLLEGRSQ